MSANLLEKSSADYERIERAIIYLQRHCFDRPSLSELALHLKLSPFYLHRLFKRWAGITPDQFLRYLSLQHAKQLLKSSESVLESAFASGCSGPGRLHDLFVSFEAVTPGDYKRSGEGLTIVYGIHPTVFGRCLIALTPRGVCHLSFVSELQPSRAAQLLSREWSKACLKYAPRITRPLLRTIFQSRSRHPVKLLLKGTNFQVKVWEALLRIPRGRLISYQGLAQKMGKPSSARAVSRAVAANPIALLIPCHRVIHQNGIVDGYRWKTERKKAMLVWESAASHGMPTG